MTNIHELPAIIPHDEPVSDTEPTVARGSTIEEAIVATQLAFGRQVTLREAHRMRRGGLGGFYATDVESPSPMPLTETPDLPVAIGIDRGDHRADSDTAGQSTPSKDPLPAG